MGCVSSTLLDHDNDFSQLGGSGLGHHIVSLTSTTYGLLTLDPPHSDHQQPPTPRSDHHQPPVPPRIIAGSRFPSPLRSEPEVINSWELMAGLDTDSFRFSPKTLCLKPSSSSLLYTVAELDSRISRSPKSLTVKSNDDDKENFNPNRLVTVSDCHNILKPLNGNTNAVSERPSSVKYWFEGFEKRCPPGGENKVVIYSTTLRGVRKTFEACNAVRAVLEGIGVLVSERDISMDRGFREELWELMKGKENGVLVPPRVFVKGRYIGGAEEVLRIHEEGCLVELLEGLPKARVGIVCDGCGGARFLPCFQCNGSCKVLTVVQLVQEQQQQQQQQERKVVVRCPDCNENGLVLCPICCN